MPVRDAGNLCNIGTLLAFVIVSLGVLILRVREPDLPRKFKAPLVWVVAPMGAISALALMAALPLMTWIRLGVWFAVGMVFYFAYGARRSKLAQPAPAPPPDRRQ
jgi:APA family basic amino acid/polyamine antiporter